MKKAKNLMPIFSIWRKVARQKLMSKSIIPGNCLAEDHDVIIKNPEKCYASLYTKKSLKTEK